MLTVVICCCAFIVLLLWANSWSLVIDESDRGMAVIGYAIVGVSLFFPVVAGMAIANGIESYADQEIDATPKIERMASLRSSEEISGSFHGGLFLGVGQIGTDTYY